MLGMACAFVAWQVTVGQSRAIIKLLGCRIHPHQEVQDELLMLWACRGITPVQLETQAAMAKCHQLLGRPIRKS